MFYRALVCLCALLAFIGLGVWVATMLPAVTLPLSGAGIGAGLGLVATLLLLHYSDPPSNRRPGMPGPHTS